jgi:putative copper export protein
MFEDSVRNVAFAIVRFSHFVSAALLFGLVVMTLLVLRPTFASVTGSRFEAARLALSHRIASLVKVSIAVAAAAAFLGLLLQSLLIADFGGGRFDWSDVTSVLNSSFGLWYGLRFPLLLALVVLLGGSVQQGVLSGAGDENASPPPLWWWTWGGLALVLLLTSSMAGHAAVSTPTFVAVLNDLVHLGAGAIWFTGIVVLASVLPQALGRIGPEDRLAILAPSVVRFSKIALLAIATVGVTGTINAFFNIESPSDLLDSGYGLAVSTKIVLFVVVLAMGSINHLYVRNRLQAALDGQGDGRARGIFRRTIAVELAVGITLLAVTGVLVGATRTRPVSAGRPPPQRQSPDQSNESGSEQHQHETELRTHSVL